MHLHRKIEFYRYILQGFLILNVLVLSAGVAATYNFYASHVELRRRVHVELSRLHQYDEYQEALVSLAVLSTDPGATSKKMPDGEAAYRKKRLSEVLQTLQADLGLKSQLPLPDRPLGPVAVESLLSEVRSARSDAINGTQKAMALLDPSYRWLFWTAGLTLIFGVIIPAMVFSHLVRLWAKAKAEIEQQLKVFLQQWFEQYHKFGSEAFSQAAFWLSILLVALENVGQRSAHPLLQILGEVSPLVRQELRPLARSSDFAPSDTVRADPPNNPGPSQPESEARRGRGQSTQTTKS